MKTTDNALRAMFRAAMKERSKETDEGRAFLAKYLEWKLARDLKGTKTLHDTLMEDREEMERREAEIRRADDLENLSPTPDEDDQSDRQGSS